MKDKTILARRPEELVYKSCYAPADLREMMVTSEKRSGIRRLPSAQLFFSLKELDDQEIELLLPHLTEEQWSGILDLDLWEKDNLSVERFLSWERHILEAHEAVARKILRATDQNIWALCFKRELRIFRRTEEDEFEGGADLEGESFVTPDGGYSIFLRGDSEKSRLLRLLVLKLYELDAEYSTRLLELVCFGTSFELEEEAYQDRRRRIEDMGFQDYYDALEIYTPKSLFEKLPEKDAAKLAEIVTLPSVVSEANQDILLLLQALAATKETSSLQLLVEELFFVCNKLLSADQVSPADPSRVKASIKKALSGINLGLDCWSDGDLARAADGIRRHYLLSFFQLGYGLLMELKEAVHAIPKDSKPDPGGFAEAVTEALSQEYPVMAEESDRKIQTRFIESRSDLESLRELIGEASQGR